MALSDTAVRNAKPRQKPFKVADGGGLHLLVTPSGGKLWRLKYRFGGTEKVLALGAYPQIGLAKARQLRDEARRQLANGVDPGAVRKAVKAARRQAHENSFEAIGREWFAKVSTGWAPGHAKRVAAKLENDLYPWLGTKPIDAITPPELLQALRRIEARGVIETAHRAKQVASQVFAYAIVTGRAQRNPAADLHKALTPIRGEHFAAATDPKAVGALLRAIDHYPGSPIVRAAMRLAPLVFVRPGELRQARWADFDLDAGEWRFTASKTKTPHIVPLSVQSLAILRELHPLTGHRGAYVFPGERTALRPMSDAALGAALRRMGIGRDEHSVHGWRATARTLLDEALAFPAHVIEHQLAHTVRDPLGRAYNRTAHLPERKCMMQRWADYLDELRAGTENREQGRRRGER